MQALRLHFPLLMRVFFALLVALSAAAPVLAQTPPPGRPAAQAPVPAPALPPTSTDVPLDLPATICGLTVPAPAKLPPANSSPVVYQLMPCFEKQGGFSVIEVQT